MDPLRNPYSPGAGRRPAALVGRERPQQLWDIAAQRLEQGRTAQHLCLYGLRGVGKTVLLGDLKNRAQARRWITASVEAEPNRPLRVALAEALHDPLSDLAQPSAGKRLRKALKTAASFFRASYDASTGWSFGLDLTHDAGGGADTGTLRLDLHKLVADLAAAQGGPGLAILVDEAQDLDAAETSALCTVAHKASQEGWPFLLVLAGLPSLPRILAEARSYAERLFSYEVIDSLPHDAAAAALVEPAATEQVAWQPQAVEYLVEQTKGYPYFLQQLGQDTWNAAAGPQLTYDDARVGAAQGNAALDSGFFRSRWERATRAEQKYLTAMAEDGEAGSLTGAVAARLGGELSSYSPARAKLIHKGLIYSPEHGVVAFTVPTMAAFILRQQSE